MAVVKGNGLAYREDIDTFSVYELFVNGIVVLEVAVDNTDAELKIFVGKQGATFSQVTMGIENQLTETKGRAVKSLHEVKGDEDSEVPSGIHEHIDGCSVQKYIYPRALHFVVEVHLNHLSPNAQPAEAADEDADKPES